MAYLCNCKDHQDAATRRQASTPDHLAYIESIMDRILVAGPLMQESTSTYDGSCFIYDTDSEEEALALLHNDPYYQANVYAQVECRPFLPAAGEWVGGKTW